MSSLTRDASARSSDKKTTGSLAAEAAESRIAAILLSMYAAQNRQEGVPRTVADFCLARDRAAESCWRHLKTRYSRLPVTSREFVKATTLAVKLVDSVLEPNVASIESCESLAYATMVAMVARVVAIDGLEVARDFLLSCAPFRGSDHD